MVGQEWVGQEWVGEELVGPGSEVTGEYRQHPKKISENLRSTIDLWCVNVMKQSGELMHQKTHKTITI